MSRGFEPSQGSPSRGRSNATGIAVIMPSAPRVCRPVARRSSCHRIRSLVERFFPDPVITRRTQVRVSSRPSRTSSEPAATTVPRSDRPRGAGIASRSRRETPKRLNRTVARMAQMASPMPTAGNRSTNSTAVFLLLDRGFDSEHRRGNADQIPEHRENPGTIHRRAIAVFDLPGRPVGAPQPRRVRALRAPRLLVRCGPTRLHRRDDATDAHQPEDETEESQKGRVAPVAASRVDDALTHGEDADRRERQQKSTMQPSPALPDIGTVAFTGLPLESACRRGCPTRPTPHHRVLPARGRAGAARGSAHRRSRPSRRSRRPAGRDRCPPR